MLTPLLPSLLLLVGGLTDSSPSRVEACLAIPDRGTEMASDKPSGGLTLAWTEGAGGRSPTSAQLLEIVRRQDAVEKSLTGQEIVVRPSGGLAGNDGIQVIFTIPTSTIPPIGLSVPQITEALQGVSDYFAAIIQTPVTVNILVMVQPLSAGTNTATSARSGFLAIPDVVGQLRASGDIDSGPALPALASTIAMRYVGASIAITNEQRICLTAPNSRSAAPIAIPTPEFDARLTIGISTQWDADPSDGLALPGGSLRFSLQDYVIRDLCGVLGWVSGVDFLSRDMTTLDLYRFVADFTANVGGEQIIVDPDALDYNPGNGAAGAILTAQFGGAAAPLVDPSDLNDDGNYYWTPISLDDADNGDGILSVGEGETGVGNYFPRLVSRNSPNGRHMLNLVFNEVLVASDYQVAMNDGVPTKASAIAYSTLDPVVTRPLMGASIPKGVSWFSRSGTLFHNGNFPDYLTAKELLILDSLGWAVDPEFDALIAE